MLDFRMIQHVCMSHPIILDYCISKWSDIAINTYQLLVHAPGKGVLQSPEPIPPDNILMIQHHKPKTSHIMMKDGTMCACVLILRCFPHSIPPFQSSPFHRSIQSFLSTESKYHMAGNFRGVLIFVIFVVIWQSRNFPTHEN